MSIPFYDVWYFINDNPNPPGYRKKNPLPPPQVQQSAVISKIAKPLFKWNCLVRALGHPRIIPL
jgi:hypothetical protein